jgi:hypothetical protein
MEPNLAVSIYVTFLKFDEKRAITSRWVIRFTLKG